MRFNDLSKRLVKSADRFTKYGMEHNMPVMTKPEQFYRFVAEQLLFPSATKQQMQTRITVLGDKKLQKLWTSFQERTINITKESMKLGLLPLDINSAFQDIGETYNELIERTSKDYRLSKDASEAATKDAIKAQHKSKIAGSLYIIAALGDALEELATNLAY